MSRYRAKIRKKSPRRPQQPSPAPRARAEAAAAERSVRLDNDSLDVLRAQRERFIARFGREPGPDDPIFFDESKDVPVPVDPAQMLAPLIAEMRKAGIDEGAIYALEQTGILNPEGPACTPAMRAAWFEAFEAYASTRADPLEPSLQRGPDHDDEKEDR